MYFVKIVSRAKESNPSFAGDVSVSIYGKDQKLLAMMGNHAEKIHMMQDFNPWYAKDYGYKRKCDARRNWLFKNAGNEKYWDEEASIVWIDC